MSDRKKKSRPKAARSRRYTANEKEKILRVVDRHGINSAREEFGVSLWSLYRWRRDRELSRSARDPEGKAGLKHVAKPVWSKNTNAWDQDGIRPHFQDDGRPHILVVSFSVVSFERPRFLESFLRRPPSVPRRREGYFARAWRGARCSSG